MSIALPDGFKWVKEPDAAPAPQSTLTRPPAPEGFKWIDAGGGLAEPPSFTGAMAKGFKRSLPETKSLLAGAGAAVAGAVGLDGVRDKLLDTYQGIQQSEVAPLQAKTGFIDAVTGDGSLKEWAGDTLGNFGGQALQSVAAAGAGALVGSAVPGAGTVAGGVGGLLFKAGAKEMVTDAVGRMVAKGVAKDVAEKTALRRLGGAAIAGTGLNVGQEIGTGYTGRAEDAKQSGEQLTQADALRAIGYGIPAGLVDTAAEALTGSRLMRGVSDSPKILSRMAKGAGIGAVSEGGTEGVQAVLERAGANQALTGDAAYRDYIENIAAGALGGGVAGAGGGFRRQQDPAAPPPPETPPLPVTPEVNASQALPPAPSPLATPPAGPLTRAAATVPGAAPLATPPADVTGATAQTPTDALPPLIADTAAQAVAAPPAADPVFEQAKQLLGEAGKVQRGKLAEKLGLNRNQMQTLLDQLHAAGIVGPSNGKKPRALLVNPITGDVIDAEEKARLDRKVQRDAEQKALEEAVRGGKPAAAIEAAAAAQGQPPAAAPTLTRLSQPPDPAAFEAKMREKQAAALTRAQRPDPAAGATSAAAAVAFDTGAAALAEQQSAQAAQDQQAQAAVTAQAEADKAQQQQQKVAEKAAKEADKAARQAEKDRVQAEKTAPAQDVDIQAVVAAEIESGKPMDGMRMHALAKKLNVTPKRIDEMRMALAQKRKRGEPLTAPPAAAQPNSSEISNSSFSEQPTATADQFAEPSKMVERYDDSPDVTEDDITPPSGGAFSYRTAAESTAKRTPGGKVFEVDGGFVVRTPRSVVAQAATTSPDPGLEDALRQERDAYTNERDDAYLNKTKHARDPVKDAIEDALNASVLDPDAARVVLDVALSNSRVDLAEYAVSRAERSVAGMSITPGVPQNSPKYADIKAALESRKREATALLDSLKKDLAAAKTATVKESLTVAAAKPKAELATDVAGEQLDKQWTAFAPETGTLAVPRAEMPQVKSEHRGAMVQFLGARGITHEQAEVPADSLKPTQAEFSASKVKKALKRAAEGEDRAILVSADGHVLDGHHQWLAKREAGAPVKAIRLNAPIAELLQHVKEFPSSTQAKGATAATVEQVLQLEKVEFEPIRPKSTKEAPRETDQQEAPRTEQAAKAGQGAAEAKPEALLSDKPAADAAPAKRDPMSRKFMPRSDAVIEVRKQLGVTVARAKEIVNGIKSEAKNLDGVAYNLKPGIVPTEDVRAAIERERAAVDSTPTPAQNPQQTPEKGNAAPDQPSPKALDGAPAEEGGATARGGQTGAVAAGGGQTGVRPDSGAATVRVPATRGGRGGAVGVSDSQAGTAGRKRRGSRGTARAGDRVPEDDAGVTGEQTPETAQPPNIPALNFKIGNDLDLGKGGEVGKYRDNVEAIRTLKLIESERRRATPDEQRVLARWVGWGGLASAFPNPETGKFKDGWEKRGNDLRDMLTPSEYRAARRSTRNAHFTSEVVVNFMWDAVRRLGYRNGLALESSMGSGNFVGLMPSDLAARFIGVEYDSITARLAGALYPQATVLHSGFQDVPLPDGSFDLNIGNPPFGDESLRFQFKPELRGLSIHNQFFLASLDALKAGGLQVQVVSSFLMDAQDKTARQKLADKADLVAAFRLPDSAFKENARTEVVTDILILRKRSEPLPRSVDDKGKEQPPDYPAWVNTDTVPDPLGGDPIPVNTYFKANPDHIIGTMDRSGKMRAAGMMNVHLDDPSTLGARLNALLFKVPQNVVNTAADVAERTEQAYTLLGEAMRISVAREEPGHMAFSPDGKLTRVIEREHGDGTLLQRQEITADSPWSAQLFQDSDGRWYKVEVQTDDEGKAVKVADKAGAATRFNAYTRKVFATEAEIPSTLRLGKLGFDRMTQLVKLRDLLKNQLMLETEDATKAMMEANRAKLAAAYKAYVDQHGPVNRRATAALVGEMPDGGLLLALESSYEPERTAEQAKRSGLPKQSELAKPAAILRERVVPKYEPPTKADTPADALAITLAERGVVDIEHIAKLLEKSPEDAAAALTEGDKPLIFKDPETNTYETADAYLSGQVTRKLMAAQAAGLAQNAKALQAVQPEPWGAENVSVQIGAAWVPSPVYADFAQHLLGGTASATFSPVTNTFAVSVKGADRVKSEAWTSFDAQGNPAMSGIDILGRLLNSQTPTVMRRNADGVDKDATTLAILKAREIASEFADWVFKDGERREQLVAIFNQKFNTRVSRQYDGQHLKLPGKVPDAMIQMRRHQKNAIWRGISSKFLLIDHVVGAGKTFTAIARAMERRRMGLAQKPTIVVPNHLVEQWQADVYRLYPGAKVLAATKKDFEKKNRRRLLSRVATGDYDIVILPHSSFGFVGISPETELRYLEEDLQAAIQAVADAREQAEEDGEQGWRKPLGVKEAERLVANIENRMAKLREGARDRLLTFEQLGIDDLTIDEAHEFKNLFYSSRMTKVRGMGDKVGSRKAADLYNKVRVVRDASGSVVFMTGTPVSNSVVELYTMMRYLAAPELRDLGMEHFDAWRAQFVDASPAFEPNEAGQLKEVTRLGRSWSNMRSLMDLYYSFTDAVTIDDIKQWYAEDNPGKTFPVPKVKGGDRQLVKVMPTPAQETILEEVIAGFNGLDGIQDQQERNAARLRLMDRARKLSLDARAVDPRTLSKEEGGKLEQLSTEVKRIYDLWTPDRGTQLVFLDRSVPKAKGDDKVIKEYDAIVARRDKALKDDDELAFQDANEALERYDTNEIEELRSAQAGGWNAYQQIKDNLVKSGIPADEIRFIQEANTDEQKQALFDAVNGGRVRVLIGSTPRMGAGTNVQQRLVALHHADVTWKPSDIEQREGRAIRQGNLFVTPPTADRPNPMYRPDFEVEILAYATERTVDAKMWSLNATKLRAINGLRKYTGDFTMEVDDSESVSMAEMAALASGNPLLLERVTLESAINNLELQEKAHRRKRYGIEDALKRAQRIVETYPERIEQARKQVAEIGKKVDALRATAGKRTVVVEGKTYTNSLQALQAATDAVQKQQAGNENARYALTIDGARVTSKQAIDDAIGSAIGDHEPFEVDIKGATYTQRTASGRALSEVLSPRASDGLAKKVAGSLGSMMGMDLMYEIRPSGLIVNGKKTVDMELWLEEDGRTVASVEISRHDPGLKMTTAAARDALGLLASRVASQADPSNVTWLEGDLDRAKRDIPTLEPKVSEPFAKAQELQDKRNRLNEVVGLLTTSAPVAAPAPSPPASFAKSGEPTTAERQVTAAWRNLADTNGFFQFKRSEGKSFTDIVRDVAPGIAMISDDGDSATVEVRPTKGPEYDARVLELRALRKQEAAAFEKADALLTRRAPDAETAIDAANALKVEANTLYQALREYERPRAVTFTVEDGMLAMDASQLKAGVHRGSALYAVALNYAHNNGIVFVPDPAGVSDDAMIRRTEHMLSSALKFGTTRHMRPHDDQNIEWTVGDDAANLLALLRASSDNVLRNIPATATLDYDWDSLRFVNTATGERVGDADFQRAARTDVARAARAGVSTLRRAVVHRSLARRAGTREWPRLAARLLQLGRTGLRDSELAGLAYARGADGARGMTAETLTRLLAAAKQAMALVGVNIEVVANGADLPADITAQDDYDDTVQAAITGDRKTVFFVASRIKSPRDAIKLVAHELVGHMSMEQLLGKRWPELRDAIKRLHDAGKWPEVFAEVSRRYERNADGTYRALDDATFAAEAIAVFAERNIQTSILQRAVNAVRAWLRRLGFAMDMSQGELRQMLWEAGQKLEGRAYRPGVVDDVLGAKPEPKQMSMREAVERYSFSKDEVGGSVGKVKTIEFDTSEADDYFDRIEAEAKARDEVLLYHVSPDPNLRKIDSSSTDGASTFGGIFAGSRSVLAWGYGGDSPTFYEVRVPRDKYMQSLADAPQDVIESVVTADLEDLTSTELSSVVEMVRNGALGEDGFDILSQYDATDGDAGWRIQKLQGQVASKLGYLAVGMNDESMSDLVLPGADIRKSRVQQKADNTRQAPPSEGLGASGASFAKAGTIVDRLQEAINPKDTTLLQRLKDKLSDWRPSALGALQLRHLGELAERILPPVAQYSGVVQRMATMRNELQELGHSVVEAGIKYQGANPKESKRLFRMLHDATLAGVDPSGAHKPLRMMAADYKTNVEVSDESVRAFVKLMNEQAKLNPGSAVSYVNRAKEARKLLSQERKRRVSHKELAPAFAQLSDDGKALWAQMRDAYAAQSDEYQAALISRIESLSFDKAKKAGQIARMRLQFESARVPFYVPLARWGEYWVSGTNADGQREFFMQESQSDQARVRKELAKAGYLDIGHGVKLDTVKAQDGASASFMADMDEMLTESGAPEKIRDEAFQLYLRSLPDLSMRKNFIHRQGTPGFSQDAVRALAGHIFHGSFQIARLRYSHELQALLTDAESMAKDMGKAGDDDANAAGNIVNELKKRHEWVMNPQDNALVNKISSIGFVYYLGLTPAAALVNLLQTPMVALPILAGKHKLGAATRELTRAMRDSLGTYGNMQTKLEGEELEAHKEFARRGVFDKSQAHNMAGISESDTHAYSPKWHKAMTVISHVFHKAEVVNREATAMAAYRLERAAGAGHVEAVEAADRAVHESQFDYSNANRARFMQSGTAKVLLMFRQYSLAVTWLLGRNMYQAFKGEDAATKKEAQRKLAGILGMTAIFSGTLGLPIIGTVGAVLNAVAAAFGDDDEPWDWETEFRAFLREMLGETGAEAVLRGPVQAATGIGIASRVSMGDLWFREPDRELEGRAWSNYLFEQAAGPMGGLITNFFRAQQLMGEGHVWRGVETMMPKAIKDGMKSLRYLDEGVNNMRGDPIVEDLNVFESLAQIAGFAPASVANAYDTARDIKNYEQAILNRRSRLMDAFALAWRLGDVEAREAVLVKMRTFSQTYPELAITGDSIRRSLMQRAKASTQADNGVIIDKRIRARLEGQLGMAAP